MNLYVANLNFEANDDDLRQLFAAFGEVTSAKVIHDRDTGRSRGFGFVEMSDKQESLRAISELNGTDFQGKTISVNEARPRTDRPQSGGGGGYNRDRRGGGGGGGYGNDRRNKW